jgi:hypothetical protein
MSKRTPTLKQVCLALIGRRLAETCVALPASVQSYDATKQTAEVKPLVQAYRYVDGVRTAFSLPVLPHCPVHWPGAGGFFFACPLQPGDQVLLVFSDRALERWWSNGQEGEAGDERTHHLKDAFVLPELRHGGRPISGLSSTKAIIGKEGGPVITFGSADIRLGGDDASAHVSKGEALNSSITTLGTAIAAAINNMGVAAPTDPMLGSAATTAASSITGAVTAFSTSAGMALSSIVKVK